MKKIIALSLVAVVCAFSGGSFVSAETGYGGGGGGGSTTYSSGPGKKASTKAPGEVLGAETETPNCTAYLTTFMRIGQANDAAEVVKLQTFLNEHMGKTIPTTGFFGPITEGVVKEFQLKYKDEVLTPWGMTEPSGYVYKTTQHKINMIKCPSLKLPPVDTN